MPEGSSAVRPTNGLYLLPFYSTDYRRFKIVTSEGEKRDGTDAPRLPAKH